ncbi:unnamed protein product [Dovyalis caffra]|uniref:F-box domain-containing protein n=1 Tax=Dovyalis caffra TaxID=77055 RepID=A0AAV1SQ28_9ROSI|nr:unnamed protein product [Dovyalis caffra]
MKHQNQVKQIHSLLITKGHLLYNPNISPSKNSKWKSTLFYNTLIRAYLNFGKNQKTLRLFDLMLAHQTPPNSHTFPSLIKAASLSCLSIGTSLQTQVIKRGVFYDPFIQTSLLAMYSQFGDLLKACKVFDEISRPCIVEYNAMLDAYAKNGDMGSACFLFKSMPKRDVVSWTSVINGFAKNGLFGEAIRLFREMMLHDDVECCFVKPNEATYVSVLSSCANLGERGVLCIGKQIHGYIVRNDVFLTVFIGTALVDFYGKLGCLSNAIKVYNQMVVKKVCTWNAMISSLANNGREKQALDMFKKMKEEGLCPNEVTFVAVLTACARAKLVEIGLELFQSMTVEFGLVPIMEHYGCVVDLLGRAGLLKEASEFTRRMPFEPDASVLGALLGACKIHGAIDLGNEVGSRLLELQPQHCSQYVVLSSINAGVNRWGVAADMRKTMLEAGIRKVPACSLIDSIFLNMCMASKSYVEEDIIIEILLRLQPKSLLRFQTVCKHWLALITSSDFIAAHCKQQPKLSVVFTSWLDQCKIPKPENSCSLRRLTEFGILLLPDGKSRPDYLNIPSSITKDTNSASLVGSSNGLLCVNMVGDRWNKNLDCCVLWNPATTQHRCLPPPLLKSSNDFREFGFGFLPKIGDYKLLRVINFPDEEIRAEVFTSSTGSWREVKATAELGCDIRIYHKPVIVKGVWYCMAARVTKDPGLRFVHFILKFDMANDSFSIMDDGVPDIRHFMVKLMLYKGLLALCFPRRDRLNKWFEDDDTMTDPPGFKLQGRFWHQKQYYWPVLVGMS